MQIRDHLIVAILIGFFIFTATTAHATVVTLNQADGYAIPTWNGSTLIVANAGCSSVNSSGTCNLVGSANLGAQTGAYQITAMEIAATSGATVGNIEQFNILGAGFYTYPASLSLTLPTLSFSGDFTITSLQENLTTDVVSIGFTSVDTSLGLVATGDLFFTAGGDISTLNAQQPYFNYPFGEAPVTGSLTINTTPLPAALPLFASGLAGLGLLGWRRKRKAQAVA